MTDRAAVSCCAVLGAAQKDLLNDEKREELAKVLDIARGEHGSSRGGSSRGAHMQCAVMGWEVLVGCILHTTAALCWDSLPGIARQHN